MLNVLPPNKGVFAITTLVRWFGDRSRVFKYTKGSYWPFFARFLSHLLRHLLAEGSIFTIPPRLITYVGIFDKLYYLL